ncbi:MAG: murein biosynthesis integral membrane protein MurJ [Ruminococcaceae bacterium]|nr:murein biosynthesis integral membrane protein MurJ [Oscillospiraceae bacterium]
MDNKQPNTKRSFAGTAVLMGVIILAAKLLGLVRDVLVAGHYGTSMEAVAYETASKLPVTIFDLVIGGVVTSAFIPVFNSLMVKKGKEEAMSFARSYVNFVLCITIILSLLGILFASPLVTFMAPELDSGTHALAVQLTRILFPMIIFTGLAFCFVGYLQSMGEYNIPALISLVSNGIMVAYLLLLDTRCGIVGLAIAMLLGWMAQAAVQIPSVMRLGFTWSIRAPLKTEAIGRAARNTLPILIGTWTGPVCNLINTRLASGIEDGRGITVLGYANRLYTILVGLFSFVATNLLFPYFSRAAASGDDEETDRLMRMSVKTLAYIIAPITVGIILLAEPFVSVIYENGSFTPTDTLMTGEALRCYAVGMIFLAVNEVLVKAFFAAEKTKLPMISSLCAMAVNVAVVALFGEYLGIGGIALVSAGATALNVFINWCFSAGFRLMRFRGADVLDIAKTLFSAFVMIPAVLFASAYTETPILQLVFGAGAGMLVYFPLTLVLRCDVCRAILQKKKGSE